MCVRRTPRADLCPATLRAFPHTDFGGSLNIEMIVILLFVAATVAVLVWIEIRSRRNSAAQAQPGAAPLDAVEPPEVLAAPPSRTEHRHARQ